MSITATEFKMNLSKYLLSPTENIYFGILPNDASLEQIFFQLQITNSSVASR